MICPGCNKKMRCKDSRPTSDRIIKTRRYLCESCGEVRYTVEILKETYSALSAQQSGMTRRTLTKNPGCRLFGT